MGAAALTGMALMPSLASCAGEAAKPAAKADDGKVNSDFGGVHIGTITYSWRDMPGGLENLLDYCRRAGVSNLELMGNDLETALGAPESPMMSIYAAVFARLTEEQRNKAMSSGAGVMDAMTDEEKQKLADYQKAYADFRKNLDMNKVEEVRKSADNDASRDLEDYSSDRGALG